MNPILEIFSQGEELVTGQIVDSNAAWLSEQATQLGFSVTRHTAVGDKLAALILLLKEIAGRADCCLCTGGLGPTSDDLTAAAVAQAFAMPLVFDESAFVQMQRQFSLRNRPMPESNRKQAMLPQGSLRLDNTSGTAPGFALQYQRCWFAFMPGVPSEMERMYLEQLQPGLLARFRLTPKQLITIKTLGLGESELQQHLDTIALPDQVELGFRATANEVQTKLLFPANYPVSAMKTLSQHITECLGAHVFAVDGFDTTKRDLITVIDQLMTEKNYNLAVIETASQGLIAAQCIGCRWLLEASFQQHIAALEQNPTLEETSSTAYFKTAQVIATAKQQQSGADLVLVQLHQYNDNESNNDIRSIVVYNLIATKTNHTHAINTHTINTLYGSLKRRQRQAALTALDFLRRYLETDVT